MEVNQRQVVKSIHYKLITDELIIRKIDLDIIWCALTTVKRSVRYLSRENFLFKNINY